MIRYFWRYNHGKRFFDFDGRVNCVRASSDPIEFRSGLDQWRTNLSYLLSSIIYIICYTFWCYEGTVPILLTLFRWRRLRCNLIWHSRRKLFRFLNGTLRSCEGKTYHWLRFYGRIMGERKSLGNLRSRFVDNISNCSIQVHFGDNFFRGERVVTPKKFRFLYRSCVNNEPSSSMVFHRSNCSWGCVFEPLCMLNEYIFLHFTANWFLVFIFIFI